MRENAVQPTPDPRNDRAAAAVDRTALGIQHAYADFARRERLEAALSIAIGVVVIPLLYLGVCWILGRGVALLTHGQFSLGSASSPCFVSAGIVWFGLGTLMAWRQVHPFSNPMPLPGKPYDPHLDPPPVRLPDVDDARSDGWISEFVRVAASGPRNILEGIAQLRDLPTVDRETITRSAQLLRYAASTDGLVASQLQHDVTGARAIALLWRLKLIRREGTFSSRWRIRPTSTGGALTES